MGGDAAQRLRCTHLSFDYARGKYPERVQEDHTISERALRRGEERSLRSRGKREKECGRWVNGHRPFSSLPNFLNFLNFRGTSEPTYRLTDSPTSFSFRNA